MFHSDCFWGTKANKEERREGMKEGRRGGGREGGRIQRVDM